MPTLKQYLVFYSFIILVGLGYTLLENNARADELVSVGNNTVMAHGSGKGLCLLKRMGHVLIFQNVWTLGLV